MRLSLRVYRLLLKLYPASFREDYHAPLQQQFREELGEVTGRRALARLWARTLWDFALSMPVQLAREVGQDSRHALRLWRQRPAHTLFAIAVLAIAIGANTGVFSVLNAVLLRSLPFTEPDRLAVLRNFGPPRDEFHDWRRQSGYLEDAATYDSFEINLEGVHQATRRRLTETSWNFFSVLGRGPALGRGFAPGEDTAGRTSVTVLSHSTWQQLFGGDPRAIGSTVRVNGAPLTVVGIAPAGFDYPEKTDLWAPTTFDFERVPKTGGVIMLTTFGRLKSGLTWTQASQAFEAEASAYDPRRMTMDALNRPALVPLQAQLAGPVRTASLILMGGVALLLLLACANVANLLLGRTVARSSELMIRSALGASRARLTQQLLTEALVLSLVASCAGLLVARWTTTLATAVQPALLSSQVYTILDWRVLIFSIGLAAATALVFGVGPAIYASRAGGVVVTRSSTPGARHTRTRAVLIATQIAVTITLLTGSIALGRAFLALLSIDNGFEMRSIASLSVSLAGTPYQGRDRAWRYLRDILRRVEEVPGVTAVSGTEALPLNIDAFMGGHYNVDGTGPAPMSTVAFVAPGFFEVMGTPVIAGREFTFEDLETTEPIAVVNEEFARAHGEPATLIGRMVTAERGPRLHIVGVARTMRYTGPAYEAGPQIFRVSRAPSALTIVARVDGRARDRIGIVRDAVSSVDPKVPVFDVKTMDERLETTLARPQFYSTAVAFFSGLGLLLAIIGVYGVTSYSVLQRTREMGIRLALGTTPGRLRATLLRQSAWTIALGGLAGLAMAIGFGRYLQSLVQGADSAIVATSAFAVLVTAFVAAAATWSATRHIARLDVGEVIRAECAD
jgi:putative ABC transport system permease protein